MLKNPLSPGLLKKAQMQGGAGCEVRGVLSPYAAAPRERANAADGSFSAACLVSDPATQCASISDRELDLSADLHPSTGRRILCYDVALL
jgi:hypothetical protein